MLILLRGSAVGIAAGLLGLAAFPASAANLIVDGGFENPVVTTPGEYQGGYVSYSPGQSFGGPGGNAWTVVGASNDVSVTSNTEYTDGPTYYNAQSGLQWLDLTGTNDNGAAVGVSQTVATTAGTTYALGFYVGTFIDGAASSVNVKINGADVGTFTNPTAGMVDGRGINYEQFFTSFTGTGSDTISFIYAGGKSVDGLDDVSLTAAAAPEPATWALLFAGIGLAGFSLRMRKPLAATAA